MGDDDDMVMKAVYVGRTLEWSERWSWSTVRSKTRAFTVA